MKIYTHDEFVKLPKGTSFVRGDKYGNSGQSIKADGATDAQLGSGKERRDPRYSHLYFVYEENDSQRMLEYVEASVRALNKALVEFEGEHPGVVDMHIKGSLSGWVV